MLALVVAGLSGCGFQSLYGTRSATRDPAVEAHLNRVQVDSIQDRRGQILRNHLLDVLTPKGRNAKPLYRLAVTLQTSEEKLGVTTANLATRTNLRVSVGFTLSRIAQAGEMPSRGTVVGLSDDIDGEGRVTVDPNILFHGNRMLIASFDSFQNEFATIKARQDAEERALRDLAREIETQLAVFFAGKTRKPTERVGAR
jgi:LPS-assembly lipoprotein